MKALRREVGANCSNAYGLNKRRRSGATISKIQTFIHLFIIIIIIFLFKVKIQKGVEFLGCIYFFIHER